MSDQDDKNCHPCHDHGEDPGVRNRYYRHKAMTAEDFRKEQDYMIERRRLINRAVIGWGVLNGGLRVIPAGANKPSPAPVPVPVRVTQGVGLDQKGREIVVVSELQLTGQNTFIHTGTSFDDLNNETNLKGNCDFELRIHYAEEDVGDSYLPSADCFAKPERRYVRESVVFSLRSVGEKTVQQQNGEGPTDIVDRTSLSLRESGLLNAVRPEDGDCPKCANDEPRTPGVLDLRIGLDKWNNRSPIEAGKLCTKNGLRISPEGLILGVLKNVSLDTCNSVLATGSTCSDLRRIAKSNDLLYALQLGWDLTRITDISWKDWHESKSEIELEKFIDKTKREGLAITFSRPIKKEDITPDCISVQFATSVGADTGWWHSYLVPNISAQLCNGNVLNFEFDQDWFNEINSKKSIFEYRGATVTIEIYGDLILDVNGLPVDANARGTGVPGINHFETGNGTPGGTFRWSFKVGKYMPPPSSRNN